MKRNVIFYLALYMLGFSCKENRNLTVKNAAADINVKNENKYNIPSDLKIQSQEEVNINGDPEKEVIITASDSAAENTHEFWFKNGKIIYQFTYPWASINKKWLVDLDNDDKKEIVRAQGYEDGVDYAIYDIVDNQQKPVLYFNPVLQDSRFPGVYLWAYPNDITELIINPQKELQVSLDNNYQRDDEHIVPDNQKELPFIFFKGQTKQPDMRISKMNQPQSMTLATIVNSVRNNGGTFAKTAQSDKQWIGNYTGRFLRMKEESGDPRGWGQISVKIDGNSAKFQLDSYVENLKKDLIIINTTPDEITLAEKDNKNSAFTISKNKSKYVLKSSFIDKTVGETSSYELEKK
ncbi:hypothetical protein [Chryseobacterium sp. SIMBA_038]|uniref:hypothetical protein n=1 Tax=Chryseobacterium sp. SIMBA_038 TaxID=3085780 RepID=UPI00397C515A